MRLYDAISFLGEGKKHADKVTIELDQMKKKFEDLIFERDINNSELQSVSLESSFNICRQLWKGTRAGLT